jgi:phosphatidate phosphatase PAH1
MLKALSLLPAFAACAAEPVTTTGQTATCGAAPSRAPVDFHHETSDAVVALGDPHHRGVDLIAAASDEVQIVGGAIAYGTIDKALEDEDVDVFGCAGGTTWQLLGTARTNEEGRFRLAISGAARLPIGVTELFLSVAGDRTGVGAMGVVLADGADVFASDVDGTLTSSEDAYPEHIALGTGVTAQAGAAALYQTLAAGGATPIYVSTRGDQYTEETRQWLAQQGFPRGPLRLAASYVTLPGPDTVTAKAAALAPIAARFAFVAGFGNRATDVTAYAQSGLLPSQIFIKLPEFAEELATQLANGEATGFTSYTALSDTPSLQPGI